MSFPFKIANGAYLSTATDNPPFQLRQCAFPNIGGGAGTYNQGTFLGYNIGRHDPDVPIIAGKQAWILGMEDNYYDSVGDLTYGPELYIEHHRPDGSGTVIRPFYTRLSAADSNATAKNVATLCDIGSGFTGQFTVHCGGDPIINFQNGGISVKRDTTFIGKSLNLTGNTGLNMSGSSACGISVGINALYANTICNNWGNSSNPGINVGTTRTDGIAFTVSNGITLDGTTGMPNGQGTQLFTVMGSGSLGIGTIPNASAAIDISSTTKALIFPRMTTTQKNAIASPVEGMVVYDLTLHKLCVRGASGWETITSI